MTFFGIKVHLSRRKSATNFLYVKTISDKILRHSLAYRSVQKKVKMVDGDVPFYLKFRPNMTEKRQISIDFPS